MFTRKALEDHASLSSLNIVRSPFNDCVMRANIHEDSTAQEFATSIFSLTNTPVDKKQVIQLQMDVSVALLWIFLYT